MIIGSFEYVVTVDNIRFTASSNCSCWHSISNSRLPTFIFRRIGGAIFSAIVLIPLLFIVLFKMFMHNT